MKQTNTSFFHKYVEFDPDPQLPGSVATKLLYSIVDINSNNGYGDVIIKTR
ncbi:MAG: hypothetical protein IPG87_21015 [Saprospiraceae bacterium]|nr:hypothetical protein [Candidatus Vicinibacter affinis]